MREQLLIDGPFAAKPYVSSAKSVVSCIATSATEMLVFYGENAGKSDFGEVKQQRLKTKNCTSAIDCERAYIIFGIWGFIINRLHKP